MLKPGVFNALASRVASASAGISWDKNSGAYVGTNKQPINTEASLNLQTKLLKALTAYGKKTTENTSAFEAAVKITLKNDAMALLQKSATTSSKTAEEVAELLSKYSKAGISSDEKTKILQKLNMKKVEAQNIIYSLTILN